VSLALAGPFPYPTPAFYHFLVCLYIELILFLCYLYAEDEQPLEETKMAVVVYIGEKLREVRTKRLLTPALSAFSRKTSLRIRLG
jgi:hypothetical protein